MSINYLPGDVHFASMQEGRHKKSSGFTLLELLTTVAIVGALSAIALPLYSNYIEKAKIIRAVSEITTISKSITAYNLDNNMYPQSLTEVGYGSHRDPWGTLYQYLNIQTMGKKGKPRKDRFGIPINTDYDLYSMGKDGKSKTRINNKASKDDVIRANDGSYIGLASAL